MFPLITALGLFLAAANGANDNAKGVATLLGSGSLSARRAIAWGTLTTACGGILSLFFAQALLSTFRGSGMVPDTLTADPHFGAAVAGAAALTVALATRFGLPISTTHALLGALVGAGLAAVGEVAWGTVGTKAAGPLLLSPVLALGGTLLLDAVVGHRWNRFAPQDRNIGRAHFVSAGAVGFARGLNDTPKIAALMLIGGSISTHSALLLVVGGMALGGWVASRRVAHTLAFDVTPMTTRQGLSANLVTSALVVVASRLGVPVSTTHVSCGALFGLGLTTGQGRWRAIARIAAAWVITLPLAASLAALIFWVLDAR